VSLVLCSLLLAPSVWATDPAPPQPDPNEMLREIQRLQADSAAMREEIAKLRAAGTQRGAEDSHKVAFGELVQIHEGQEVDEVVSFGNDVEVAGHVIGNAVSFGGDVAVTPTGRVDGDVVSFGGQIEVADGAHIGGNRVAMELPVGLPVTPLEAEDATAGSLHLATDARALLHTLYRRMVFLLSIAGAGVLVVGLFPTRVTRVAQDLETRPIRAAVVGTLATGFLALFAGLFAVVTLGLGLPVSVLLVGLLGLAWLLGFVGLCQAVGDRLPLQDRPHGRWIAFVIGVVLITFLGSLPWVGWMVVGGVSMLGIGSALTTRFGRP
jgi:cytoskeletal protein CcmA (bactofilin family)